jgi:hypothetical protein
MDMSEIPFIIYAEATPNPASLKFVANKLLLVSGASAIMKILLRQKMRPLRWLYLIFRL